MSVTGPRLQPTIFERGRAGRGGGKIPHPPADALDRLPGRRAPRDAAGPARDERAGRRPSLRQPVPAQLRGGHRVLPAGLVHDEVQPEAQRVGRPPAGLRRPASARPGRRRPGHAAAPVGAGGGPRRDLRDARRHAPAGGRRAGRADRHPDDPGLPPGARRYGPRRGPRPGQLARHQPGDRVDGRLPDDHGPVGSGRRRGPGGVPLRARAAHGGRHDHEPLHAGPVRVAYRRAARRGPRGGRPGLHGRRQPQRHPRPVQAR